MILCLSFLVFFLTKEGIKNIQTNAVVSKIKELPKPEISGGSRGELGIDKNINEVTIDEYLNREDSVYRDMRMLEDPGDYEKIGGDRFLSGYIEGFEVIPLPYIIPVTGLPSEVGDTYTGTTLFRNDDGRYIANYEESMDIIEEIFPKDKVIFLMCGGGGYSGMTKNFLVSLGWDENKIYNTGGYWYYKGDYSVSVKKEVDGEVFYDFENVPYHNIEFEKLTKSAEYKSPEIKVKELKISTSKIEIEEGTSFRLNVIVLPNEATNKDVKLESSDEKVATVTDEGVVQAIGEGKATITVQSIDESKKVFCEVTVNKKVISTRIKLDDVSKEAEEFALYDPNKLFDEMDEMYSNSDGTLNEKYYTITEDGVKVFNDLGREKRDNLSARIEEAKIKRLDIFNNLINNKKSFIILIHTKECEEHEYVIVEGAQKILKENNYSYFYTNDGVSGVDDSFSKSNIDFSKWNRGSIAILKDGEIYASIDPDVDSIKNDEELKNWLSKYIEID